jgi:hypothetical protein
VRPVATQPGTSGEYAEYPVAVPSITMRHFMSSRSKRGQELFGAFADERQHLISVESAAVGDAQRAPS